MKGGDARIAGWEHHERRMKEEGFTHSVVLLAEALEEKQRDDTENS